MTITEVENILREHCTGISELDKDKVYFFTFTPESTPPLQVERLLQLLGGLGIHAVACRGTEPPQIFRLEKS